MGCIHSCTCGGICPGCSDYQPEAYCGDAEDRLARQMGYRDYDDHMQSQKQQQQQQEYDAGMEEDYYANHPDNPKNAPEDQSGSAETAANTTKVETVVSKQCHAYTEHTCDHRCENCKKYF